MSIYINFWGVVSVQKYTVFTYQLMILFLSSGAVLSLFFFKAGAVLLRSYILCLFSPSFTLLRGFSL